MALSWNEIKSRAIEFQNNWQDTLRENSETQSFYNDFFEVFGISRRRVATFEEPVRKLGEKKGRIDLFWKGTLLVEQKSRGKDLQEAYSQALDYFPNLKEEELPKYVLVSDFNEFELYDLDTNETHKFQLKDLHKNIHLFAFIAGYKKKSYKDTETVSIEASELMGELYDCLKNAGYQQHDLELFLVRILFCLFADDTGIFEKSIFHYLLEEKTKEDGSDIGMLLAQLFQVLNTDIQNRQYTLDQDLAQFPYVNGNLFERTIMIPSFDSKMRGKLIKCCYFDWSNISPAIFGSLFQSVADKEKRRSLGEHYTTEKNILKTISPLFLDDLHEEFNKIKHDKRKLKEFHNKLSNLTFLDPACGCGNFLIIAYREIRRLEIEILKILYLDQRVLNINELSKIDVDKFYGIEIEEFPAKIAEVALWLMDHQMNLELSEAFGLYFARIPLKKSAKIVVTNALTTDWFSIIKPENLSYIFGNPPFIGARMKSKEQAQDMQAVFEDVKGYGDLDYVSSWYIEASKYIQNTNIKCAFVSTNSITQGMQVGILWNELFNNYNIKIHFAHRTFLWDSEARGKAHVHCVIIGFANFDIKNKRLFDYENIKGDPHESIVKNINAYLVDASDVAISPRSTPICDVPKISTGNKPIDDGNYLFSKDEMNNFIEKEPASKKYFYRWIGAQDLIKKTDRFVLLVNKMLPNEISKMPLVKERIENVRLFRLKSLSKPTQDIAKYPTKFHIEIFPEKEYLAIPVTSSERRKYIPIAYLPPEHIPSVDIRIIRNASLYHFGLLTSLMHMIWTKYICGRLKSDYRYSKDVVYNNFPFPKDVSDKDKKQVEQKAQNVLDTRAKYKDSSLADLYNPETMPPDLTKAHNELDKAVDLCYGKQNFKTEAERMSFLFNLYTEYTSPLLKEEKSKRKKSI
jgi:hypothetical protein